MTQLVESDAEFAARARGQWRILVDWIEDARTALKLDALSGARLRAGSAFLDIAPGDGTRYRLSIVRHVHCSKISAEGTGQPTSYMVAVLPGYGVGILPSDPDLGPLHPAYVTKTLWRGDPPDRFTPLLVTDVFNLIFFGRSWDFGPVDPPAKEPT